MGMTRQQNGILLAGICLFVVGLVVGFGGAELISPAPAEADEAADREARPALPASAAREVASGNEELAAALVELNLTLASLRGVLERGPAALEPRDAGRTLVGQAPAPGTDELAASIQALAAALRDMPAGGSAPGTNGPLVIPGWVDRRTAFDTEALKRIYRDDAGDRGERAEAAAREWRTRHLFWSKQDVLNRYGKPDDVYHDDGFIEWCYMLPGNLEEEDIDFAFDEGLVVEVEYSYDWEE